MVRVLREPCFLVLVVDWEQFSRPEEINTKIDRAWNKHMSLSMYYL